MTLDHTLSWEVARVGGVVAYLLVTGSVVIGLLLSLKVRSDAFPRFVTNELHRYVSLLAIAFTIVHGLAVWLDPFTAFTPAELLVPLASHYRPIWIALGIVAGYLLVAMYVSEWLRGRIGYAWWRRLHYLTFIAWIGATVHGIATGSDTSATWALAMYGGSVLLVVGLIGARIVTALADGAGVALALLGAITVMLAAFTVLGPARSGWNVIANNGNGNGASATWLAAHPATTTASTTGANRAAATPPAGNLPTLPLQAQFEARLTRVDRVSGRFVGASSGTVTIDLGAAGTVPTVDVAFATGATCHGSLDAIQPGLAESACRTTDGTVLRVVLSNLESDGQIVAGELRVTRNG